MCICMCVYAQLFVTNFTYMCNKIFTLFACIIFCCPYFVCSVAAGAHNLSVWSSGNLGLLVPITWRWSICLWFMFCLLVIVRGFLLQILLTFNVIFFLFLGLVQKLLIGTVFPFPVYCTAIVVSWAVCYCLGIFKKKKKSCQRVSSCVCPLYIHPR